MERRDATGALVMLLFSVTAQIAHDGVEKVRKEGELSGAAVLALGARRLEYDGRGKDNRVNVHAGHYISATRSIYPPCLGPVEVSDFPAPSPVGREKSKNVSVSLALNTCQYI